MIVRKKFFKKLAFLLLLFSPQDRESRLKTCYDQVKADGEKIHALVEKNLELFQVMSGGSSGVHTVSTASIHAVGLPSSPLYRKPHN